VVLNAEGSQALSGKFRIRRTRVLALNNASKQLKAVLSHWETAYNEELFYRGIRILPGATAKRFFEVVMATLFQVFTDGLGHLKHVHLFRAKDRL
jgi:hypothetical protein